MKFSANLGLLWKNRELPAAITLAAAAGFDAVECHWPYQHAPQAVAEALQKNGLGMVSLNTRPGDFDNGERGLAALPERVAEARRGIDEAVDYAAAVGCRGVHVMAGVAAGAKAYSTFADNLAYAAQTAAGQGLQILIEPINTFDMPGYFLHSPVVAAQIINDVGADNLKLLFDCYHIARMEGRVAHRLEALLPYIGHVQIASVPERHEPDRGELDYRPVFDVLRKHDYRQPIGAEYVPAATEEQGLGWLAEFRGV